MVRVTVRCGCFLIFILFITLMLITLSPRDSVHKNGAYVTFLSGNGDYATGVRVLFRSVQNTGTEYPFVVIVSNEVSEETRKLLRVDGCLIRDVDVIPNPNSKELRYRWVYTKLRSWELYEYDRIVFIDADAIVLSNIDELFSTQIPEFAVVADCCDYFNTGVMVLTPSKNTFLDMMLKLPYLPSYDNGDQGFLNEYYKGKWYPLLYKYNAQQPDYISNPVQWNIDSIKILHYEGKKPWVGRDDNLWTIHKFWWQYYEQLEMK